MNEKELKIIWKKYIDKKIYRIVPAAQKSIILKKGFDPSKDPYEKVNPKIKKMFQIIIKLEKRGVVFEDQWKSGPVKGSIVVMTSMRSVKGKYIDFVAKKKQIQTFRKRWDGGCLVTYVNKLTNFLLEKIDELDSEGEKLARYLNKWSKKRMGKKSEVLYIKGSNKIFETAIFYCFIPQNQGYWESPFGSFQHFVKVIKKQGLRKYLPFLKGEKLFYLRVRKKISPKEIKFEK